LLHTVGHLRVVSWSPALPGEFALTRGEERVLLFARTRFGRSAPMLRRDPSRGVPRSVEWIRRCRLPALAAGGALPGQANRPLTSSVATTARSRRLRPASALRRMQPCDHLHPSPQRPEACALRPVKSDEPPPQDAFCRIAHDVLRPRRNSNAASTPRIEPLASVHRVLAPRLIERGERAAPWLDRAPSAVPARLATTLHDERKRSSTRDACDRLLPTTLRRRAPTTRSVIRRRCPLARTFGCLARFTTPQALRMGRLGGSPRALSSREVDRLSIL
jgi:hypothetical protein